jgi:coenzyme F420 hydrogenase subunit beta
MEIGKTIKAVIDTDLCHGCGTCVAACPLAAIEMIRDDSRGLYIPRIDFTLCDKCSTCLKVCPGHSVDFNQLNMKIFSETPKHSLLGVHRGCYAGYATDNEIRYKGASGGVVTTLLISALDGGFIDGALVTKMNMERPLEPESFIARTREDINCAAKSKYCPVPANIALKEILDVEGKYAVVGLPCHIHGIRKYEQINKTLTDRIVLHIGIFCGYTYSFLATEFLLSKHGIRREDVNAINYRGEGWPGRTSISLNDKRKVFIPTFELYKTLELTFRPWRCALCCDGSAELADISCGDAWLPRFTNDTVGTSIVMPRTPHGEEILNETSSKGYIYIKDLSSNLVIKSQPCFFYKKAYIKLFLYLAKIWRKGTPKYATELSEMRICSFIKASLQVLGPIFSSRRYLWRFLPLWHNISRKLNSSVPDMTS